METAKKKPEKFCCKLFQLFVKLSLCDNYTCSAFFFVQYIILGEEGHIHSDYRNSKEVQ